MIAGSNRAWALALIAIAICSLLIVTWLATIRVGASPLKRLGRGGLPLFAIAMFGALIAAQWHAGWQGELFFSASPYSTLYYLVKTLTYGGAFMLVLLLARDAQRRRMLLLALAGSGLLQALLAIYLLSIGARYLWFFQTVEHSGSTQGTFANRDHLAAYLCLSLSAGIGLLMSGFANRTAEPRRFRDQALTALQFVLSSRMLLRMMLVVMVIALVLTRSRMGNAAFFGALMVLGITVAATQPALRRKALLLVASLLIVDLVIVGQWIGLERVVQRLEQTAIIAEDKRGEETVEHRLEVAWLTLPMIEERPLFGWGGGTFYTAFTPFKTREMNLSEYFIDHAHNDYAEIAADVGLVGLGLLAIVVSASLWRAWRMLAARGLPAASKAVAYAALMAITCLLLHSSVDFNLQISANALTITVVLALLWATPIDQRSSSAGGQHAAELASAGGASPTLAADGAIAPPVGRPSREAGSRTADTSTRPHRPGRSATRTGLTSGGNGLIRNWKAVGAMGRGRGQAVPEHNVQPSSRNSLRSRWRVFDRLALVPLAAVAGFGIWHASLFVRASFQVMEARWFVSAWNSGQREVTVPAWERARNAVDTALEIAGDDPDLFRLQGSIYTIAAEHFDSPSEDPLQFYRLALRYQRVGLALRPYDASDWAKVAETMHAIDAGSPDTWAAWHHALEYGPFEASVHFLLCKVGFQAWGSAPDDVRTWLRDNYRLSTPRRRRQIEQLGAAFAPAGVWQAEVERMQPLDHASSMPDQRHGAVPAPRHERK